MSLVARRMVAMLTVAAVGQFPQRRALRGPPGGGSFCCAGVREGGRPIGVNTLGQISKTVKNPDVDCGKSTPSVRDLLVNGFSI